LKSANPARSEPAAWQRPLHVNAAFWRRLAYVGARYGPELWVRHSPAFFGVAFAAALAHKRRAVRENLRRVVGRRNFLSEELDVFRTFANYARCLAEALAADRLESAHARRRTRGKEHLESVFASGRGALVVTAHAGPWDAAARLLAADYRASVMVVMSAERDAKARALHDDVRTRSGVRLLHVGSHPLDVLPLLRHLRNGGIVAVQLDRVPAGQRSIDVSLFGEPARVPEGPFALAALASVPVLPVFVRRVGYLDYEFVAGPAIALGRRPDAAELNKAAQRAIDEMERFIFAHPTQWFQFEPLP